MFLKYSRNIIRIITGCGSRDSCRNLLKNSKILPLPSQYILSLLLFVVSNKNKLKLNSGVCNTNTTQKIIFTNLHQFYHCFNNLPHGIKNFSDNPKQIKSTLNYYLYATVECKQRLINIAYSVVLYRLIPYVCNIFKTCSTLKVLN